MMLITNRVMLVMASACTLALAGALVLADNVIPEKAEPQPAGGTTTSFENTKCKSIARCKNTDCPCINEECGWCQETKVRSRCIEQVLSENCTELDHDTITDCGVRNIGICLPGGCALGTVDGNCRRWTCNGEP